MRPWILGLSWVVCLTTCLVFGHPPELGFRALALTLFLLGLDLSAVRLPGLGFVSCSAAITLAMGVDPRLGCGWAALALATSLLLRALLRPGHPQPSWRLLEHLAEGFPVLAALTCLTLVHSDFSTGWAVLVYFQTWLAMVWLLSATLPPELDQLHRTVQFRLAWIRLACCSSAILLASADLLTSCLFLPILLSLRQASDQAVRLEEQRQRADVVQKLHKSSQNLAQKEDEYRILERACQQLLGSASRAQTGAKITDLVGQLCACDSIVVLALDRGQLQPIGGRTPHQAKVHSAGPLGLSEPMVDLAWRNGSIQLSPCGARRIFDDEGQALAFPLGGLGVLYVGRKDQPFAPETLKHLTLAASVAGLGLQIACHLEDLSRQAGQLQGWSQALAELLRHSLNFLESATVEELAETTRAAASSLFSCQNCRVELPGLSLELDDGWIGVPVVHPGLAQAGLIAVSSAGGQRQQDLLCLLANLTAIAWKNLLLKGEIVAAQGQLVQSAKLAAVGQLAAGVAHELNTPLSSVALNLDMAAKLLRDNPNEALLSRLQRATDGVLRSKDIIDNLLLYSRQGTAGKRPAQLHEIVSDALELVRQPLALGGVDILLELQPVPLLEVNPIEIQQVLMNLLLNARDAVEDLPAERRKIHVRTTTEAEWVVLSVIDHGRGISPQDQARLFEPFYTTKPVGKGTGLGLSLCEQIAKAHGARLEFTSQQDEGSEFRLLLPRPAK